TAHGGTRDARRAVAPPGRAPPRPAHPPSPPPQRLTGASPPPLAKGSSKVGDGRWLGAEQPGTPRPVRPRLLPRPRGCPGRRRVGVHPAVPGLRPRGGGLPPRPARPRSGRPGQRGVPASVPRYQPLRRLRGEVPLVGLHHRPPRAGGRVPAGFPPAPGTGRR